MRTQLTACISATLLLSFCVLTVHSQGGSVSVLFAESDASGSESNAVVTAPVRVEGDNTENLTVIATPLTVAQYQADPGRYRNSCDSIIQDAATHNLNPAEETDFNGTQVEMLILSDATEANGRFEFDISIPLLDDTIREPEEYFLLVLDARQSPATDSITFTSGRDCISMDISADEDAFSIRYEPPVVVVSEGAGTVEIIRAVKQGQVEGPVQITFSGAAAGVFTISPSSLTLQPDETSANISITVVDNQLAEDNRSFPINANSQFGTASISITIQDNDRVVVGFNQSRVTVTEGETITLSALFKNNFSLQDFQRTNFFQVFTQQGTGNATESHYTSYLNDFYIPGEPIEIQTTNTEELERPRQFEVKMTYPVSTPLVVIEPDTVIITIKDNDGVPNKPTVLNVGLTKDDITITWTIDRHELHPVHTYVIKIRITGSRNQESNPRDDDDDGDSSRVEIVEFNMTTSVRDINCKANAAKDQCIHTLKREIDESKQYNVTVCAKNDIGITCGEPTVVTPTVAPLKPSGLATGSILGIVFGIIVAVLLCCLLWILIVLIVCCSCEREKIYNPEKKEKENQKQRENEKYSKISRSGSESPVNDYV